MRVLINTPDPDMAGGVAAFYHTLRGHLHRDVDYFTIDIPQEPQPFWTGGLRCLRDGMRFSRTLRKTPPDVVCVNPSFHSRALPRDGLFLLIAKRSRRKVIVFIHGWGAECERVIRERCLRLFRFVFFRADAFVVLSAGYRDRLIEMGYRGPIYVGTTAVEDSCFPVWTDSTPSIEEPARQFRILFLARIERTKGIYETLEAYRLVREVHSHAILTVAGDGSELENVRRYVRDHQIPNVTFTGYVRGEAKQKVFLSSDCYLFPSHSEGMPISVLEAMACGLPVVTRAVGGLKDFFENERMGFITESLSPAVYAEYVNRLVSNAPLREQMGRFNRVYAKEHFAASKVALRYEDIYRNVLAGVTPEKVKVEASVPEFSTAEHVV